MASAKACIITLSFCIAVMVPQVGSCADRWYAGRWDSRHPHHSDWHPVTIALRVEVWDESSHVPISDAEVRLEGRYVDDVPRGSSWTEKVTRKFELTARTGRDGIAVLALRWQKRIVGTIEAGQVVGSRVIDDIEKVQMLEVRHRSYEYAKIPFTLARWLGMKPDPDVGHALVMEDKEAWRRLFHGTPDAKYFVLELGERFKAYGQEDCTRPEFFEHVRDEKYGMIYEENLPHAGYLWMQEQPQRICGPYLMLPLRIKMKRLFMEQRVDIDEPRAIGEEDRWRHDSAEEERRAIERREVEERVEHQQIELVGEGYISEEVYKNIESYVNTDMTEEQVISRLGKPWHTSISPIGNTVHHWQSRRNSLHNLIVVVKKNGKITRIERTW